MQILLVGVVIFALADLTLRITDNVIFFPTVMMIGAFHVPVVFVAYFYQQETLFDRGAHTGSIIPTLILCALFGGLIGTLAAGLLEHVAPTGNSLLGLAWVGVIEEAAKLIAPVSVFVLMRDRFRSELDGLLFGVATGMAFAALETMGYELVTLLNSRSLNTLNETILARGLLSPAGHAAWTGLITATLWRERERTGKAYNPLVLAFFLLAAGLHTLWNFAGSFGSLSIVIPSYIVIGGASLALLNWRLREARNAAVAARVESSLDSGRHQELSDFR